MRSRLPNRISTRRQKNRDAGEIDYAKVIVYQTPGDLDELLSRAADCDLVIKHSGVGAEDELLERAVLDCASTINARRVLGCGCSGDARAC